MASDENPLWSSSLHKEAFDLLVSIWPRLDASARERLIARIIDGPPSGHENDEDFAEWQIFERLAVLHRLGHQLMPSLGAAKLAEIKIRHEAWEIEDGERAHFLSWTESGLGYPTKHTDDGLLDLTPDDLVTTLTEEKVDRYGLLQTWSVASQKRPNRAVALLLRLASQGYGPADLWRATLFGLREAVQRPAVARRVLAALAEMPDAVLSEPDIVSSASDCLHNLSQASAPMSDPALWRLWQRLALSVAPQRVVVDNGNWVNAALNRPAGKLAEVLLNHTFIRQLKVNERLPQDLRPHFDLLANRDSPGLRLSRVMLAIRISYLFAVDPVWTKSRFLPLFDWTISEDEAAAVWQGYLSHGRIGPELWAELETHFFDGFTNHRLSRLGDRKAAFLGQLLMVVGIELPQVEPPVAKVRGALRVMTALGRRDALVWTRQRLARERGDKDTGDSSPSRADRMWEQRVRPWLAKVWPKEAAFDTPETSQEFARIAIATDQMFDNAVEFVLPFLQPVGRSGLVVRDLQRSGHPDRHPSSALALVGRSVTIEGPLLAHDLRNILDRIISADASLSGDPGFRRLDAALRAKTGPCD